MTDGYLSYMLAEPTQGVFPRQAVQEILELSLHKVIKRIPDHFGSRKEWLEREKVLSKRMTDIGYASILNTFNRDELRFGDAPTTEIDAETIEGFKIKLLIGEKAIVIRFTHAVAPDKIDLAAAVIPRLKEQIMQTYPLVKFEDYIARPEKL